MSDTLSQEQLDDLMAGLTNSSGETDEKDEDSSMDKPSADSISDVTRQPAKTVTAEDEKNKDGPPEIKKRNTENDHEGIEEENTHPTIKKTVVKQTGFSMTGKKTMLVITIVMLLVLSCAGIWHHFNKKAPIPSFAESGTSTEIKKKTDTNKKSEKSEEKDIKKHLLGELDTSLSQLEILRQKLLKKQKEILNLENEYQEGIDEVKAQILSEKKQYRTSFQNANRNRQINLKLRTIQRKELYRRKLNLPFYRLFSGSEKLLYVKRLANVDIKLADMTAGLDKEMIKQMINNEIAKQQFQPADLVVSIQPDENTPLEIIWNKLVNGKKPSQNNHNFSKKQFSKTKTSGDRLTKITNREILKQICKQDYSHVFLLTDLEPEGARCLSKWKGSDLFINNLKVLTPIEAEYLSKWQGKWLGLNGLTTISPGVARSLMNWQGDRLSLNSIEELPAKTAFYLSKWSGKQIELISLKFLSPTAAEYLNNWQRKGGKIYVPPKFRGQ